MPGRMPGPGAYKMLEWGPEDERKSVVRDSQGRMLFSTNLVRSTEHNRDGRVVRLVDETTVEVLWRHAKGPVQVHSELVSRTDRKIR